ncbi:MAG: fumarylacetoacetate hydrolase family protein, partial [Rhodospirillales bacterium]|nr:fumarylacetoacetate hydrolase family protein [Rhodospirillales bacterium]
MGNKIEKENIEPLFFLKSGSVIIAPNQEIHLPQNYSEKYDWEVKIAAIIGRQGRNITVDNALDIVTGYTIFNDVSARDVGRRTDWPFGMDWFCYKS